MIAFIQGTVRLIRTETIVVDVQGIGYEIYVSRPETVHLGKDLFLYTYQYAVSYTHLTLPTA